MSLVLLLCGSAGWAGVAEASGARAVVLQRVALRADARDATLTLGLSAPTRYRVYRLRKPERLVITLAEARRHAPLPTVPSHSLITAVRAGAHPRSLTVVLALRSPVSFRSDVQRTRTGVTLRIRVSASGPVHARQRARDDTSAARAGHTAIRALHAPPAGSREVIVAVDAGHGGVDPGATGPDGIQEKVVTLAIARDLAADIDHTPGMHAFLTRHGDYFVALRERRRLAHQAHADLFVSIHADSAPEHDVAGASVYILSERGASSEAARRLADQQNAADLKGGISLAAQPSSIRSVLLNLSQNASMSESGVAAQDVLVALDRVGQIRKPQVQHAAFVVLKSPDIPSMLIETAYISNRTDERRLAQPAHQKRLAEAILRGIQRYFRDFPPQGSLFARLHAVASPAS